MAATKRFVLFLTLIFMVSLTALLLSVYAEGNHWSYGGTNAPKQPGELASSYTLCADGSAQSPIDIRNAAELDLVDIDFYYGETANNIVNTGFTIQVDVDAGSAIVYNGITYQLVQFHFHYPGEHTIDGQAAAMEIHFVHQDLNSENLAVVGIMLQQGEADNGAYAPIFDNLPPEVGEETASKDIIALEALLPEERRFYTYQGSLTTPPCSEIVRWLLLDTPVELSAEQIAAFAAIYDDNARPVQVLGKRDVLRDRS